MVSLKVEKVTLGYGRQGVLKEVSLEASPGQMVGIIGPNGSGKSTLLKAISGVLPLWAGRIAVDGWELSRMSRRSLAQLMAVVPQNPSLPESFTALEIVLMGRYPHLGLFRYETPRDLAIAWEALESTGIDSLAQRRVGELSGGERQRLIIARALAQEPKIILLDEPTAHLDVQHQLEAMGLVRRLVEQGMTAIVAIHDLSLASRFCDPLLLLNNGGIWAQGPPQSVITPENIKAAFSVEALVYPDPLGHRLIVSPQPRRKSGRGHVHVIGGGGRGAEAMHSLYVEGFEVSAGVLNEGDTDLAAARALGIEAVVIPPFATVDQESHRRHLELVSRADCVVVTDMPFGRANLSNLEAATLARRLLLIEETPIEQRDFTGGEATALYRQLRQKARGITWQGLLPATEEALAGQQWPGTEDDESWRMGP